MKSYNFKKPHSSFIAPHIVRSSRDANQSRMWRGTVATSAAHQRDDLRPRTASGCSTILAGAA